MSNITVGELRALCLLGKSKGIDGVTLTRMIKELKTYKAVFEKLMLL